MKKYCLIVLLSILVACSKDTASNAVASDNRARYASTFYSYYVYTLGTGPIDSLINSVTYDAQGRISVLFSAAHQYTQTYTYGPGNNFVCEQQATGVIPYSGRIRGYVNSAQLLDSEIIVNDSQPQELKRNYIYYNAANQPYKEIRATYQSGVLQYVDTVLKTFDANGNVAVAYRLSMLGDTVLKETFVHSSITPMVYAPNFQFRYNEHPNLIQQIVTTYPSNTTQPVMITDYTYTLDSLQRIRKQIAVKRNFATEEQRFDYIME